MPTERDLVDIDPNCPEGGSWYACHTGSRFLGCCQSNPCQNGCPAGNLKPASFNASDYGNFPDQECSAGQFYTCANTHPPFLGCCESENPCNSGSCSQTNLAAAFLSNDLNLAGDFLNETSAAATSTASSTITTSVASKASSAPIQSFTAAAKHTTFSEGASIGTAVGAFAFVVTILALLIWLFARRRRHRKQENPPETPAALPTYTKKASADSIFTPESTKVDGTLLPKWTPYRPTLFPCKANVYTDPSELWMNPDSMELLHGNGEAFPQSNSVEIAELDSVCVGSSVGRSGGSQSAGNGADKSERSLSGRVRGERPRPLYVPYRPGAKLENGHT